MKRRFCLILMLMITTAMFAGCGSKEQAAPAATAENEVFVSAFETTETEAQTELSADDSDYYALVSEMDKLTIENYCAIIREAYLNEDWEAISVNIRYPIFINEKEIKNEKAFLAYMKDKTIHESDRAEMESETCKDMFVNGEGICLGSGQIWVQAPSYMTDEYPTLEIIAISGIVDK